MRATLDQLSELDIDPALGPEIEELLSRNFRFTLPTIPAALKPVYFERQLMKRRPTNRVGLIACCLFFDLFLLVQVNKAPDIVWLSFILRFAVFTPSAIIVWALDYFGRLNRFYDAAYVFQSFLAICVSAVICMSNHSSTVLSDERSIPLMLLVTSMVWRLSPLAVIANSVISLVVFAIALCFSPMIPRADIPFLIDKEVVVLCVARGFTHMMERNERIIFFLRALDSLRRQELTAQNRGLRQATETDALTGVANRRCFDETLQEAWAQGLNTGEAVGLIMMDVDHFKKFNDYYGHQCGDDCLQRVASVAAGQMRDRELFARYGGEEFAVIVPQAALWRVATIAERLRATIEAQAIPHAARPDLGHVTVSLGVASAVPTAAGGQRQIIEMADQQLYEAKKAGRNCVRGDRVLPDPYMLQA